MVSVTDKIAAEHENKNNSYGFLIDENKLTPLIESIERDYLDFKVQV